MRRLWKACYGSRKLTTSDSLVLHLPSTTLPGAQPEPLSSMARHLNCTKSGCEQQSTTSLRTVPTKTFCSSTHGMNGQKAIIWSHVSVGGWGYLEATRRALLKSRSEEHTSELQSQS